MSSKFLDRLQGGSLSDFVRKRNPKYEPLSDIELATQEYDQYLRERPGLWAAGVPFEEWGRTLEGHVFVFRLCMMSGIDPWDRSTHPPHLNLTRLPHMPQDYFERENLDDYDTIEIVTRQDPDEVDHDAERARYEAFQRKVNRT